MTYAQRMGYDEAENKEGDEFIAEMRARREWFDRFMARRQRIARWSVVLYAAAASAVVVGMWRVADTGNGDTLALLASGYAGLVALTWIGPVLTRRGDQKE